MSEALRQSTLLEFPCAKPHDAAPIKKEIPTRGPGRKCTDTVCHVGKYCEDRIWIPTGPDSCVEKALAAFHRKYQKGKSQYSPRPEEHCDTCEFQQGGKPLKKTCPHYDAVKKEHECIFRHRKTKKGNEERSLLTSEEDTVRLMTTLHSCDHWKPALEVSPEESPTETEKKSASNKSKKESENP